MSSPSALDNQALLHFFARKGFYRHIQIFAQRILAKKGSDPTFTFWYAAGLLLEGSTNDAIRALRGLQGKREVALACHHSVHYMNKNAAMPDISAMQEAERGILTESARGTNEALILAAYFLLISGDHTTARKYVDRIIEGTNNAPASGGDDDFGFADDTPAKPAAPVAVPAIAFCLRGWIDATCGREAQSRRALEWFEKARTASDGGTCDLETRLGKANFLQARGKLAEAVRGGARWALADGNGRPRSWIA